MTKSEREDAKQLARILYTQGLSNKEIAEKTKVSENSVSKWIKENGWDSLRAAQNVTRAELVNKILRAINDALDRAATHKDDMKFASLTDQLCKLASTIEKIEKKSSIVDVIEVFMAFGKWLQYRSQVDSTVTPELIKRITQLQDLFISEQMTQTK